MGMGLASEVGQFLKFLTQKYLPSEQPKKIKSEILLPLTSQTIFNNYFFSSSFP